MGSCRTCGNRRAVRTFGPGNDRYLAGGHIGNHHRNKKWAYALWAFLQQYVMLILPCPRPPIQNLHTLRPARDRSLRRYSSFASFKASCRQRRRIERNGPSCALPFCPYNPSGLKSLIVSAIWVGYSLTSNDSIMETPDLPAIRLFQNVSRS